ncbi:TauD/TfdA family dioxygenase [Novosphingobium sp. TH158]|uniref:TauD/TfdA dioxygenase family protein n=1 Tax=Novosphingobium sp. TH158 TaxID=2067455 RepID=UPI000C7E2E90|nr:TauD/TfdA family dioxygenase [Novosphingobium sp. TH158]PLK26216.1 TauD/TfdA family dioxygenase [Novosphingobium sp. TH158]
MPQLAVSPLKEGLPFGVRIAGVTQEATEDAATRDAINALFHEHGVIVFEGMEPSDAMQVALSNVFGPLKEHPVKNLSRVDADAYPGVVKIHSPGGSGGLVDIGGKQLSHWLPWHFDHAYNDELNFAGVLRATQIVPEGGLTGFCDGIALYKAFPKDLLARIEDKTVIYTLNVQYETMRFGLPENFRVLRSKPTPPGFADDVARMPRALHPAVWTRKSGEKVLHVSPWMCEGIAGMENAEGDALLQEVCQTINELARDISYHHKWSPTDMLIWDNTRVLHSVSGHDPALDRTMQRTTIKGDYGLGRFEGGAQGGRILSETTV